MPLTIAAIGGLVCAAALGIYLGLDWRRSRLPLRAALRAFVSPPVFPNEDDNRQAKLLTAILQWMVIAIVVLVPPAAALRRDQSSIEFLLLGGWAVLINAGLYLLAQHGRVRLASWLLPATIFVMVSLSLFADTGFAGPSTYLVMIVGAGLLLGGQGGVVYALLSSLMVLAVAYSESIGLIRSPGAAFLDLPEAFAFTGVYVVTALLLRLAVNQIRDGMRQTEQLQLMQRERNRELDQSLQLERKRTSQLELLTDSARRLTGLNDSQALIDAAARRLVEAFNFETAAVFLVEDDELVLRATHGGHGPTHQIGWRLPLGEGVIGQVASSGSTFWVRDAAHDQRLGPPGTFEAACEVAVPLRLAKSVIGVLEVASTRLEAFDDTDVRTIESLADLIAAGLQAGQLFNHLRSRQQMTETLRRIGAAINESLNLPQIVDTVCSQTRVVFAADRVELWLTANGGAELRRAAACGPAGIDSAPDNTSLARPAGLIARGRLADRATLITSTQLSADVRQQLEQLGQARSLIVAPLTKEHRSLGVLLIVETQRAQQFTADDASAAELLADQVAAAIANASLYAAGRRRADELALLNDITRAALEISDVSALLDTLAERLGELIGADGCYLVLWDPVNQTTGRVTASSGLRAAGNEPGPLPRFEPSALTEQVLRAGRAITVDNQAPLPGAEAQDPARPPALAVLGVPLIAGNQWLGAAHLAFRQAHAFSEDEITYAERAGRQIALAMSKALALEAERRRGAELQALHQASLRVQSSLDLGQLLQAILRQALQLTGGSNAHIFLYDGERLDFASAMWSDGERRELWARPRPGGLTDTVARTGQRIVVPDVDAHPLFVGWKWGGAIIGLPLRIGERVRGVMNAAFERPRRFDEHELQVLDLLANQAAVAIENARLFNAEREQRELAEALRAASVALSSTLEFEAVLDRLLDQIERVVPFDAAAILLVEAGGARVHVARSRGYERYGEASAAWVASGAFDLDNAPNLQQMTANHRPLIIADTWTYAGWSRTPVIEYFHAWAGVPIVAHQQVLAFFVLDKAEIGYYRQEHADRLAAFAGQAALALQNARLFEAERQRSAQLTLLSEVSQQAAGTLDEPELLQRVVTAMIHRLGFAVAGIVLPVGDQELEVVAVATNEPMSVTQGFRQKVGLGVIGHAAETRTTYLANDVSQDPYYFDPAHRSTGSALALPLLRDDKLLGVLYIETSTRGALSAADVLAFETLANHIATALENARLYASASSRLSEMTALQSVSQTIVSSLELGNIFETVVRLMHDRFGYAYVSIYELRGDRLHLKAQIGYPEEMIIWDFPITSGVSGRAVRTRQTQFIVDVRTEPEFLRALPQAQSEICIPLLKDTDTLGILNVESGPGQTLTAADVSLLSTFASQVTIAIQNARLFEAEREQRELAEALRQASLVLSSSLDFDTVLDRLLEQIGRVVPYDAANIMLVEGNTAWIARHRGYDQFGEAIARDTAGLVFDIPTTPNLAQMLRQAQPLIVSDTAADITWVTVAAAAHVRSWAGAPILAQGEVLAFFSLDKREAGFYQPEHAARLAAFAGQAALALENARLFAAQRRRSEEQRLLLMAASDFSAALSESAVLEAVTRHMTAALNTVGCVISRLNSQQDKLVSLYADAALSGALDVRGTSYRLADYPARQQVLQTHQPLVIDLSDPSIGPAERALLEETGHARRLLVPLFSGEGIFGLVELVRDAGSLKFSAVDQQLAQSLAAQAAAALENARLHAAVQENVRELDALLKANEALLSTLDLDPLLQNILAAAVAAIPPAEMGAIILTDPASGLLRARATFGYEDPRVRSLAFSLDEGYSGKAIRQNSPLLVTDTRLEPQISFQTDIPEMLAVRSAIVAPLVPKGTWDGPHGVISLDATRAAAFTPADLRVLVAFANTAAVAIDNARLHAEVQRLAVTDSLTGLANPRAFERALSTEAYRAGRYGHPLSLIIMDIDSFKQYNDTYGHLAGNQRLKAIADVVRDSVRDPDLPVRYGGEEFALLLPHTSKAGAIILAERIRESAQAAAPITEATAEPASGYTLSLGVATFPDDALTAEQLLLAADNAELAAKRAGKNRVCSAEPLAQGVT